MLINNRVVHKDKSTCELLDELSGWLEEARELREEYDRHQSKMAVKNCPPSASESKIIFSLYCRCSDIIYYQTRELLDRFNNSTFGNHPGVEESDVYQESYIIFQRLLLEYDSNISSLRTFISNSIGSRIRNYLKTQLVIEDESENRSELDGVDHKPNDFNLESIYEEVKDQMSDASYRLWLSYQ